MLRSSALPCEGLGAGALRPVAKQRLSHVLVEARILLAEGAHHILPELHAFNIRCIHISHTIFDLYMYMIHIV